MQITDEINGREQDPRRGQISRWATARVTFMPGCVPVCVKEIKGESPGENVARLSRVEGNPTRKIYIIDILFWLQESKNGRNK